ncbi:MAG: hypothetical protein J6112_07790 [Clostridia bacterium]|nr:hypothetical protein [Clostridia bacterium]
MKKRTERNGNRTARSRKTGLVLAALFFAALLLAAFAGLFSGNSYADGARFLAEWPEGVYDVGEDINFEISISPLAAGKKVNGKITATIRGLDVIFLEPGPGFDIRTSRTPGVLVIEFSSDAGYFTTAAGKAVIAMLRCSIGSEDETKIQLAGSYTENGTNVTIPTSLFTIERYVPPTPTPSPTPEPTPTPGPEDTPVPTETPSPSPTIAPTDTPSPTPTPTMAELETPTPATPTPVRTPAPTAVVSDSTPEVIIPEKPGGDQSGLSGTDPVPIGAVVFWAIVAIVAGIWIGIVIGAVIWRKRSIFVTDEEKKILGKK